MIKIKIPADNLPLAAAIGAALVQYGAGQAGVKINLDVHYEAEPEPADEPVSPSEPKPEPPAAQPEHDDAGDNAVDKHGVGFNGEFCGKAKVPFYSTSKRKGQWKKRQGVSDTAYENWYASQIMEMEEPPPSTASAFAPPALPSGGHTPPQFAGAGQLMKWVSDQVAAGKFDQAAVTAAYATAGITISDLFSGTEDQQQAHLRTVHGILAAL